MKKKTVTLTDVCYLAHALTERECYTHGINIDCRGVKDCKDKGQNHRKTDTHYHYGETAQIIFNDYYDIITNTLNL